MFKSLLKVYYRTVFNVFHFSFSFSSLLKVYTLSKTLPWIKPLHFSLENECDSWYMHQTVLFSSSAVVPRSKSTRCQARRRHFIMTCDIFGTGQTNVTSPQWRHSSNWNQYTRPNYWKSYWREPHTHSTEGFDDSLETCEIRRGSVSEPVFKHNHCALAFATKNVVLGRFLISSQEDLPATVHFIVNFSNCLHVEFPINKIDD